MKAITQFKIQDRLRLDRNYKTLRGKLQRFKALKAEMEYGVEINKSIKELEKYVFWEENKTIKQRY